MPTARRARHPPGPARELAIHQPDPERRARWLELVNSGHALPNNGYF